MKQARIEIIEAEIETSEEFDSKMRPFVYVFLWNNNFHLLQYEALSNYNCFRDIYVIPRRLYVHRIQTVMSKRIDTLCSFK